MKTQLLALVAILLLPACVGAINLIGDTPNTTKESVSITDPVTPETRLPPPTVVEATECTYKTFCSFGKPDTWERNAFDTWEIDSIRAGEAYDAGLQPEPVARQALYNNGTLIVRIKDKPTLQWNSIDVNVNFSQRTIYGGTGVEFPDRPYLYISGSFNEHGITKGYVRTDVISKLDDEQVGSLNALLGRNTLVGNFIHTPSKTEGEVLWAGEFIVHRDATYNNYDELGRPILYDDEENPISND